ncbi:MAG TPA: PTS sugar transporter subunit IIC [Acetobacteraceae bacterium]|jgi:PTS system mannose-specific IIC component|nr:PTS sugar transporter subunit IIC [Acetobacteraceae bacterium]
MIVSPLPFALTLLWGTVVGLDLVSVPQGLLSRPLVAATVAGLLLGDLASGLLAGMVLELYALDVLPIGASRYPDFSVAAVAGGVAAALVPDELAVGIAGLVGLPMAALGGWTLQKLRRRNAVSVQRRLERVARGDGRAIWELQRNGFLRDAVRSFALALLGVGVAMLVAGIPWDRFSHARFLSWAVAAGGIAAALGGAIRSAGSGGRRHWLAVGLATGIFAVVMLR